MLDQLINRLSKKFPGIELHAKEYKDAIHLNWIKVPTAHQNQGIGTHIINAFKQYAENVHKDIVLEPSPQKGKRLALLRFYKRHGFVPNRGNHFVVAYYRQWASTMYYRPQ